MQSPKLILAYGAVIWAILVVTSLILRVYETGDSALFESLKFVVLAAAAVGFSCLYLQKVKKGTTKEGFLVGSVWLLVAVGLDLVLYALGLFNLGLASYFKDVASSYFIMPLASTIIFTYLKSK